VPERIGASTSGVTMKTLIIDNYDSFTVNLFQLIAEVNGVDPIVVRNDQLDWPSLREIEFDNIVLSPGAGRPEVDSDFGVCRDALDESGIPILGVCLGHQGLAHSAGAAVVHAPSPVHGRSSMIRHVAHPLFEQIPERFSVVRYHSLVVSEPLPPRLEPLAWTEDGLLMAMAHRDRPHWGVQFHPESIGTEFGRQLLTNFAGLSRRHALRSGPRRSGRTVSVIPRGEPTAPPKSQLVLAKRRLDFVPDTEAAFVALYGGKQNAFWLDSSLTTENASRFSFMGAIEDDNGSVIRYRSASHRLEVESGRKAATTNESIFSYLKRLLHERHVASDDDLPFDFNCGFVGYFGYELKAECGGDPGHSSKLPDAAFFFADRMVAVDHREGVTYLLHLVSPEDAAGTERAERWFDETAARLERVAGPSSRPIPEPHDHGAGCGLPLSRSRERHLADIAVCLDEIRDGESYEICLTNKLRSQTTVDPLLFYRALRRTNPAPYSAYLRFGDLAVACASPERFLRIDRTGLIESKPIKGTRPRGATPPEDLLIREELRGCEKDRAENLMIVDLVRNDLGVVSEVGSVKVPSLMEVETYSSVHQLVSTVRGQLREGLTGIDVIRAAFPGGSMTGAPKRRTMSIIDGLEGEARGIYSGAIGFLGLSGAIDLNIVIRTAVFDQGVVEIGVGGAIVALSDAEDELAEMLLKGEALARALDACANARMRTSGARRDERGALPEAMLSDRRRERRREAGEVRASSDDDARDRRIRRR